MSEYQYYEFAAADRPLTTREQAELRSLSTRADITATSFVNTYQWGNLKGDPSKLMERYFDAHLYLTNWGTREVMLRLPTRVLDPAVVADYCVGDSASAWTSGKHVIIRRNRENEGGTDECYLDAHGLLASIIGVRTGLVAGDLRLLYLGWLRCVQSLELADDEPEPPVPAGLGRFDAPLTAVAEFLCMDPDLLTAAAAGSAQAAAGEPTTAQLRRWVLRLPAQEKDAILSDLISGNDSHLRSQLSRRYRDAHSTDAATTTAPRTAGKLLAAAADLRDERERRDAEQRERDRARRERSAAAARQRHLDTLAIDQPAVLSRRAGCRRCHGCTARSSSRHVGESPFGRRAGVSDRPVPATGQPALEVPVPLLAPGIVTGGLAERDHWVEDLVGDPIGQQRRRRVHPLGKTSSPTGWWPRTRVSQAGRRALSATAVSSRSRTRVISCVWADSPVITCGPWTCRRSSSIFNAWRADSAALTGGRKLPLVASQRPRQGSVLGGRPGVAGTAGFGGGQGGAVLQSSGNGLADLLLQPGQVINPLHLLDLVAEFTHPLTQGAQRSLQVLPVVHRVGHYASSISPKLVSKPSSAPPSSIISTSSDNAGNTCALTTTTRAAATTTVTAAAKRPR